MSLFLPLCIINTLLIICKTCNRRLSWVERRQTGYGPQDPRDNMRVSFLGFLFAACSPDFRPRKPPPGNDKKRRHKQTKIKAPQKLKDQKRGSLARQKILGNNCFTPGKQLKKIFDPTAPPPTKTDWRAEVSTLARLL